MPTERAEKVAEALWRLKRADKLAPLKDVARQAGFRSNTGGKTMLNLLKSVRRDWPHLQWWRAVENDGIVEKGSEREQKLREAGVELVAVPDESDHLVIENFDDYRMDWSNGAHESGSP